jgi:hypothetical protein
VINPPPIPTKPLLNNHDLSTESSQQLKSNVVVVFNKRRNNHHHVRSKTVMRSTYVETAGEVATDQ